MSDASTPSEPADAEMTGSVAGSDGPTVPAAGRGGGAPPRAGSGGAGGMSAPPAATAGAGGSANPGECESDADCERRNIPGGTCVDRKCFARDPECDKDEDCVKKGPEYVGGRCAERQCLPNPRWRCEPAPPASPTDTVRLKLPVIDALNLSKVRDISIVACNKLDYMCMRPVTMTKSDMMGDAYLDVPANFAGYMQQNESRDFTPGLYFVPTPLPEDGTLRNFPMIASALSAGLALPLRTSLNSERGHIMVIAEDCMGKALPGIQYTSPQADMGTVVFYTRDQVPNRDVMDTPTEGTGGFVNLPEGPAEITLKQRSDNLHLATVTVLIRRGYISAVYVRPIARGSTTTGVFPTGGSE